MDYSDVKNVVHVTSGTGFHMCEICNTPVGHFEQAVNHYLQDHNGKLLQLGTESILEIDNQVMHRTAAVLSVGEGAPF